MKNTLKLLGNWIKKNWKLLLLLLFLPVLLLSLLWLGIEYFGDSDKESDTENNKQVDDTEDKKDTDTPTSTVELPDGVHLDSGSQKLVYNKGGVNKVIQSEDHNIAYLVVGDYIYFGASSELENFDALQFLYKYSISDGEYTLIDSSDMYLNEIFEINGRVYYIFSEYMSTGTLKWFPVDNDKEINAVRFVSDDLSESITKLISLGNNKYVFTTGWGDVGAISESFYVYDFEKDSVSDNGYSISGYGGLNGEVFLGFVDGYNLVIAKGNAVENGLSGMMWTEGRIESLYTVDISNNNKVTTLISKNNMPKDTISIQLAEDNEFYLITLDSIYKYSYSDNKVAKQADLPNDLKGLVNSIIRIYNGKTYIYGYPYDETSDSKEIVYLYTAPDKFEVGDVDEYVAARDAFYEVDNSTENVYIEEDNDR